MIKRNFIMGICIGILLFVIVFSLTTCTAGPNTMKNTEHSERKIAGFWQGLWHGMIIFITFIISLFNKNVNIYEIYNNGGWYNFGFLLGVMIVFGGSSGAGTRASCSPTKPQTEKKNTADSNDQEEQ